MIHSVHAERMKRLKLLEELKKLAGPLFDSPLPEREKQAIAEKIRTGRRRQAFQLPTGMTRYTAQGG